MKATEVSKYVIAYINNVGDLITNKHLQKLLYYIEAWGQVHYDGLIDEDFEAWVHGPVIPSIYNEYKGFGANPIVIDYNEGGTSTYLNEIKASLSHNLENSEEKFELIDEVLQKYGVLTSFQLELLSHSEDPWKNARGHCAPIEHSTTVIPKNVIKTFYTNIHNRDVQ